MEKSVEQKVVSHEYSKRVVAYLDILGFKDHLKERKLSELIHALELFRFSTPNQSGALYKPEVTVISDSVIIAADITIKSACDHFLKDLIRSLAHLSLSRVWIRGAITYGDYFKKNDYLVSPALSEAYLLETKSARVPRVILGESALNRFHLVAGKHMFPDDWVRYLNQFTCQDSDGFRYIDYLKGFREADFVLPFSDFEKFLPNDSFEKTFIKEKLNYLVHRHAVSDEIIAHSENSNIKSKFIWVANQHNRSYKELFQNRSEFEEIFGCFSDFSLGIEVRHKPIASGVK
ncbi:MAG: hypothetical protein AB7F66_04695 [Bacteriovoracia bacterium]